MRRRVVLLYLVAAIAALLLVPTVQAAPTTVVYIGSQSTAVTQEQIDAALPAFQTMVSRDLQRYWGVDATLTTDPAAEANATMVLYVTDSADGLGALGEHDVANGRPIGWVYAGMCQAYNDDWRLVLTHELQEMLVDPWVNRFSRWHGRTWLVEVADPVESGYYAYWIDGVPISDFITPAWYGDRPHGRYDYVGALRRPGQVAKHGYASYWDGSSWQQVFA